MLESRAARRPGINDGHNFLLPGDADSHQVQRAIASDTWLARWNATNRERMHPHSSRGGTPGRRRAAASVPEWVHSPRAPPLMPVRRPLPQPPQTAGARVGGAGGEPHPPSVPRRPATHRGGAGSSTGLNLISLRSSDFPFALASASEMSAAGLPHRNDAPLKLYDAVRTGTRRDKTMRHVAQDRSVFKLCVENWAAEFEVVPSATIGTATVLSQSFLPLQPLALAGAPDAISILTRTLCAVRA